MLDWRCVAAMIAAWEPLSCRRELRPPTETATAVGEVTEATAPPPAMLPLLLLLAATLPLACTGEMGRVGGAGENRLWCLTMLVSWRTTT